MTPLPTTGWILKPVGDENHVIPLGDLREHDDSQGCWCKPFNPPDATDDIWAHNSMDRREEHERGASLN